MLALQRVSGDIRNRARPLRRRSSFQPLAYGWFHQEDRGADDPAHGGCHYHKHLSTAPDGRSSLLEWSTR